MSNFCRFSGNCIRKCRRLFVFLDEKIIDHPTDDQLTGKNQRKDYKYDEVAYNFINLFGH